MNVGVMGLSEGNGHPFSWSAICNGYDPEEMADCGYPVIPQYLSHHAYPRDFLSGVTVTHVWTQSEAISRKIARATHIAHVCRNPEDMIGEIDALLLARDDADSHLPLATPYLQAGIPVYVDKPLALSVRQAEVLYALAREPWRLFSCSALYFADELLLKESQRKSVGPLRSITAITPKYWETYAPHVLDPVLRQIPPEKFPGELQVWRESSRTHLFSRWTDGLVTHFHATGRANCSIRIHYVGDDGEILAVFSDSFAAFRTALAMFFDQVRDRTVRIPPDHVYRVIRLLEAGWTGKDPIP